MAFIKALSKKRDLHPLINDPLDKAFGKWDTNIYHLKSTGATESVNSLTIRINQALYYDYFLKNIKGIFGFDNFSWANIKELTLDMEGLYEFTIKKIDLDSNCKQLISQAVECFSKYIPNIEILDIRRSKLFEPAEVFENGIANLYSRNLKKYCSNNGRADKNLVFSDRLEFLDICMRYPNYSINLKHSISSLKELRLVNPPADFDWRIFNNTKEFSTLEFPNLHTLNIEAFQDEYYQPHIGDESENQAEIKNYMLTFDAKNMSAGKTVLPALTTLNVATDKIYYIQRIFCSGFYYWPNIKTLEINKTEDFIKCLKETGKFCEQNVETLYMAITNSMPRIDDFRFNQRYGEKDFYDLQSRLDTFYADQAKHMSLKMPLQMESQICSDKDKSLDLQHVVNNSHTVKKNKQDYECLHLDNVSNPFNWSNDEPITFGNVLIFNELDILYLEFNEDTASCRTDVDVLNANQDDIHNHYMVNRPIHEYVRIKNCSYASLQNIFGIGKNKWANIKGLSISIGHYSHSHAILNNANNLKFKEILEDFAYHIYNTLPELTSLSCEDKSNSGNPNYMFAKLAQLYAPQLEYLSIDNPIDMSNLYLSFNLRWLYLDLDKSDLSATRIYGRNLRHMRLNNLHIPFNWKWFYTGEFNNVVNLRLLYSLFVDYSNDYSDNGLNNSSSITDKVVVYMNNLEKIEIDAKYASKHANYPLCYLNFNTCMYIILSGNVDALPICTSSDARCNRIEFSNISASTDSKEHFYQFANSWFGSIKVTKHSSLSLIKLGFELDPQEINWVNLKILVVDLLIDYQSLLGIIPKLKRLIMLTLKKVSVKSLPANCQSSPIQRLSNSVKNIELVNIVDCSKKIANQSVEYLVCALPTLSHILIGCEIDFNKAEFIDKYHQTYPHITNIGFKVSP